MHAQEVDNLIEPRLQPEFKITNLTAALTQTNRYDACDMQGPDIDASGIQENACCPCFELSTQLLKLFFTSSPSAGRAERLVIET